MTTRQPTIEESARWTKYKTRFIGKTKPMVQSLIVFAELANSAENEIESITGVRPEIIDDEATSRVSEIGRRAQILDNQITGVLLQKYGVQFDNSGALNIVGSSAPEEDIYPTEELSLGFAPIIIVAGIAAVTLLIAGDQAEDRLEKAAQIEAIKLQQKMLEADRQMMNKPEAQRRQWESWKKTASVTAQKAAKNISGSSSWLEKFVGSKGTSILVAGIVGVAALYFLLPKLRRN